MRVLRLLSVIITLTLVCSIQLSAQIIGIDPQTRYRDTQIGVTAGGLWRLRFNNGSFTIEMNTASAGDFSTKTIPFAVDNTGAVTIPSSNLNLTGNVTIPGTLGVTGIITASSSLVASTIGPTSVQQHTIPGVSADTFTLIAASQTLTNKTLTAPTINSATISGTLTGNATITGNVAAASVRGGPVIFAARPSPSEGMIVAFTDSTTINGGTVITGGGTGHVLGVYNGTNWVVVGGSSSSFTGSLNTYPKFTSSTTLGNGNLFDDGLGNIEAGGSFTVDSDIVGLHTLFLAVPLNVAGGGTGGTTFSANAVLIGSGASPINAIGPGTSSQVFIGGTPPSFSANPTLTTLTLTSRLQSPTVGPNSSQQHTLPAVASDTVTLIAASQTLTNKTLTSPTINGATLSGTLAGAHTISGVATFSTSPVISTITNSGTLTLPTATDTLVGRSTTDTLTNKTLTSPVITGASITVATLTGAISGTPNFLNIVTFTGVPVVPGFTSSTGATIDLPASSDRLVGRNTTDTLTNKTLTSPIISTISNTGTLTLPSSTDTLVGRATTDTLVNKTLTSPIVNGGTISSATITGGTVSSLTLAGVFGGTPTITAPTITTLTLTNPLTVANGGTGTTSLTSNGILYGNGSGAVQVTAAGSINMVLTTTNSSGLPAFSGDVTLATGLTAPILRGTSQILAGNGTVSVPSIASNALSSTGFYFPSLGVISLAINGSPVVVANGTALNLDSSEVLGWASGSPLSTIDTKLSRIDVHKLGMLDGSNANQFRVYGNATQYISIGHDGSTGAYLYSGSSSFPLLFGINNTATWNVTTSGDFSPVSDNSNAIGSTSKRTSDINSIVGTFALGTNRTGDLYIGGNAQTTEYHDTAVTSNAGNLIVARKSRGTQALRLDVTSGDQMLSLRGDAYSASLFNTAEMDYEVDDVVVDGQRPASRIRFSTNAANSSPTTALTIDRNQKITGTGPLQINGAVVLNSSLAVTGAATLASTLAVTSDSTFSGKIIGGTAGPASGQQHTIPAVTSDTFTLNAATQTLTNKTLTGVTINSAVMSGTITSTATFTALTVSGAVVLNSTLAVSGSAAFNSVLVAGAIGPNGSQQHVLPAVTSDTIALLAASQTFTNKTLTTPTINAPTLSNGTISGTSLSSVTITGSTISNSALTGTLTGSPTLTGIITFTNMIVSPTIGPTSGQQHTLPSVSSDTVALLAATQTFTNKTLTSPTVTGAVISTSTWSGGTLTGTLAGSPTFSGAIIMSSTLAVAGLETLTGGLRVNGTGFVQSNLSTPSALQSGTARIETDGQAAELRAEANFTHSSFGARLRLNKARGYGGGSTPTDVVDGDVIGNIIWGAYTSGTMYDTAKIVVSVDGFTVNTNPGAKMDFYVSQSTTGGILTLTLDHTQLATFTGQLAVTNMTSSATGDYVCFDTGSKQLKQSATACTLSSERYKDDIQSLESGALDKILQMRPVTFLRKDHPELGRQLGFIAEETVIIDPRLIWKDGEGRVNQFAYENYTATLTKAVQELTAESRSEIDALKKEIQELKALIKQQQ